MQPAHQVGRDGQEDAGDRHREEHHERQQVGAELLDRQRAAVAAAPPHRQRHARDHEHRRDVEDVEHERRQRAGEIEREHVQAEHERLVALLRGTRRLEMNPPEGQGERDRGGEHAAPEDEPVRRPPQRRSFLDEPLRDDVHGEERGEAREVLRHARRREEQPPAAPPEETRGRFRQPHRVAVPETERGKHTGARVRDKRRIEIPEPAAAEIDAGEDQGGNEHAPSGGASDVSAGRSRHERSIGDRGPAWLTVLDPAFRRGAFPRPPRRGGGRGKEGRGREQSAIPPPPFSLGARGPPPPRPPPPPRRVPKF